MLALADGVPYRPATPASGAANRVDSDPDKVGSADPASVGTAARASRNRSSALPSGHNMSVEASCLDRPWQRRHSSSAEARLLNIRTLGGKMAEPAAASGPGPGAFAQAASGAPRWR